MNYKNITFIIKNNTVDNSKVEFLYLHDEKNLLHHSTLPSLVIKEGKKVTECYFSHGIMHRKAGPCYYSVSDDKEEILYMEINKRNKNTKIIDCNYLQKISESKLYFRYIYSEIINGTMHREDGPAEIIIFYKKDNVPKVTESWYLEGKKVE